MSDENLEIVRRMYAEARERPEALYEFLADDVHWDSTGTGQLEMSTIHGRDGVMQFFRSWIAPFEEWSYEAEELLDAGDCVIAHVHQWGRGKASGIEVEQRFWQVWTLRDGKAVRTTHHREKAQALEAAGLSE
jgi:ketosteroid isomerase-like protein